MPKMIPMVALVAFDRNGKSLQAGDEFSALPIEAASLNYNKKASFATVTPARSPALGTRAMTAAPLSKPPAPPNGQRVAETEQAEGRRRGRGNYSRRDMAVPPEGTD